MILGVALQGEHERVAVDDAGRRRHEPRHATYFGLHLAQLIDGQPAQIGDAVGRGLGDVGLHRLDLRLVACHHHLADTLMRDAALGAIGVQLVACLSTHSLRFERALGVVQPGMDDLGVARAGVRSNAFGRLQHDDFAAGQCQFAGDGEPDHARPDHHAVDTLGHGWPRFDDLGRSETARREPSTRRANGSSAPAGCGIRSHQTSKTGTWCSKRVILPERPAFSRVARDLLRARPDGAVPYGLLSAAADARCSAMNPRRPLLLLACCRLRVRFDHAGGGAAVA